MRGTGVSDHSKCDSIVGGDRWPPGQVDVSSCALPHWVGDVPWSIRHRIGLFQRPAARSAPAPQSVSADVDSREESVSRACEPTGASMSYERVYKLIDLISSSSIGYTNRLFTVAVVLTWSLFSTVALNRAPTRHPRHAPVRSSHGRSSEMALRLER